MKNNIKGWKDIFKFTYIQGMKGKSTIITNIIFCLVALLSMPVITIISGEESDKAEKTDIKYVKIVDMTGLNVIDNTDVLLSEDLYEENEEKLYTSLEYSQVEIDFESLDEEADLKDIYKFEEDDENLLYLELSLVENSLGISVIYDSHSDISEKEAIKYCDFVEENFDKVITDILDVNENAYEIMGTNVEVVTNDAESLIKNPDTATGDEEEGDKAAGDNKEAAEKEDYSFAVVYAILMVVMIVLSFGGELIAMSIATEKASRVMEYLLTSVKPMAIVVGKILSSLAIIFTEVAIIAVSMIASCFLNKAINGGRAIPKIVVDVLKSDTIEFSDPMAIITGVLIFIGGFLFFALIAALAGASVSKLDELTEGIKMFTFILIIGAYIAIFVVSSEAYKDSSALVYAAQLIPVTSAFLAPGTVITGYLSVGMGLVAFGIMVIAIILLTKFVANVYESMIYYNGQTLKFKDIINISKNNRSSQSTGKRGK